MEVFVFVFLIAFNGFLSAAETAIFSLSKYKIHSLVRDNKPGANILAKLRSNPNKLLATLTITANLIQIFAASLATFLATKAFGSIGVGIATGIITVLVTVFGENIPKTLGVQNAAKVALFSAPIIDFLARMIFPLVAVLESISNSFTKVFRDNSPSISEEELKAVIAVSEEAGILGGDAADIMENVIEFEDLKVAEIMTPEVSVAYLDARKSIKEVLPTIIKTDYHRFPVFDNNEENVVGVFDVDIVLRAIESDNLNKKVGDFIVKPYIVPETKKVADLLRDFAKDNIEFALVVDEHGSFTGVASLDDILEEIVGDIFDKSLRFEKLVKQKGAGVLEIQGKARVSDLEKILHVSLKGDGFSTLSGLIQDHLGRIPKKGEKVKLKNFEIEIIDADDRTIRRVNLRKLPAI